MSTAPFLEVGWRNPTAQSKLKLKVPRQKSSDSLLPYYCENLDYIWLLLVEVSLQKAGTGLTLMEISRLKVTVTFSGPRRLHMVIWSFAT